MGRVPGGGIVTRFNAYAFICALVFFLSVSVAAVRAGSSETRIVATGLHQGPRVAAGVRVTPAGSVTVQRPSPRSQARHPHPTLDWMALVACEASGDWHANTGNGFYGGPQFLQTTWESFGGLAFAARADLATRWQQIRVAERVLRRQGLAAWPACTLKLGWR